MHGRLMLSVSGDWSKDFVTLGVVWLVLSLKLNLFHVDRGDLLETFGRLFCGRIGRIFFSRSRKTFKYLVSSVIMAVSFKRSQRFCLFLGDFIRVRYFAASGMTFFFGLVLEVINGTKGGV